MRQEASLVAIDVGTTKVCTLVGRPRPGGDIDLLGYGLARSRGMHKGSIIDLAPAQEAVAASVQEAQRSSGLPITSAYVGVTGVQVASTTVSGEAPLGRTRPITSKDVRRAQAAARTLRQDPQRETLHFIPLEYAVDGLSSGQTPVGMQGTWLSVETHVISSPIGPLGRLRQAVAAAGVQVRGLVLEPIASGEAVLSDEERESGVGVADIGGGTTDVAVFRAGRAIHAIIIPVAGYQLTNDISLGLSTPYRAAEGLKVAYGDIFPQEGRTGAHVPVFGVGGSRNVSHLEVNLLIEERMAEVFHVMLGRLQRAGCLSSMPAGLVLTGGSAQLPGLSRLASDILDMPVRVGYPQGFGELPEELEGPAFSTAAGILLWAQRQALEESRSRSNGYSPLPALRGQVQGWVRDFFMRS